MLLKSHIATTSVLLFASLHLVNAATSPSKPNPFVSCGGVAVSKCPSSSGCCTVGACCGTGCCDPTQMCVFAGTAQAGCCPFNDPTGCGSTSPSNSAPSNPSSSNPPSNDPVPDPNCTRVRGCVNAAGSWTCLLGKPCGLFKGDCGTCPALTAANSVVASSAVNPVSSVARSSAMGGSTTTRSSGPGNSAGASMSSGDAMSSGASGGGSPVASSSPTSSSGTSNDAVSLRGVWVAWKAVVVVPAFLLGTFLTFLHG